jgi:hypothetical protein
VGKRVIDDLKQGNPRPFIGLAAGAGVLGPAVSLLKSIPQGRFGEVTQSYEDVFSDPKSAASKAAENIATVGALGLFDQTARAMRRGDTGWWEFMGGPVFSDITQGLSGPGRIAYGSATSDKEMRERGVNQIGRFVGSHVPVVGSAVSKATRALTEDVTRTPTGLVLREGRQPLGTESPPMGILGMQVPSPRILFGLEQSATARREGHMEKLKAAVASGDRQQLQDVIKKAQADGVIITATSIKRLIRDKALEDAGIQR